MGNIHIVTLVIIAANVIISMKGFKDYSFFEKYKFNIGYIKRGEQFRMFSSGFLHLDFSHLLFNMLTLYFFTNPVLVSVGAVNFVLIYVASLLIGNLFSFYFHKNELHYSAIGASGAVSGILYSAILFYPNMSLYLFFVPIPIPAWLFGILYLLYSIYGMKKRTDNIGHDAHFGGALAGYFLTILMAPSLIQTQLWIIALLSVPLLLLFILIKFKKI